MRCMLTLLSFWVQILFSIFFMIIIAVDVNFPEILCDHMDFIIVNIFESA